MNENRGQFLSENDKTSEIPKQEDIKMDQLATNPTENEFQEKSSPSTDLKKTDDGFVLSNDPLENQEKDVEKSKEEALLIKDSAKQFFLANDFESVILQVPRFVHQVPGKNARGVSD